MTLSSGAVASDKFGKLGTAITAGAGGIIGIVIAIILLAFPAVNIFVTYEVMSLINVDATSMSEIGQDAWNMIFIYALIFLAALGVSSVKKKHFKD